MIFPFLGGGGGGGSARHSLKNLPTQCNFCISGSPLHIYLLFSLRAVAKRQASYNHRLITEAITSITLKNGFDIPTSGMGTHKRGYYGQYWIPEVKSEVLSNW